MIANYIPEEFQTNLIQSGAVTKRLVLFLYLVTAPYAVGYIFLVRLFLNNGLSIYETSFLFYSNPDSVN
jgi:hypothetical protein